MSWSTVVCLICLLDILVITLSSVATSVTYHLLVYNYAGDVGRFALLGVLSSILFLLLTKWTDLNSFTGLLQPQIQVRNVLIAWCGVLLLLTSFLLLQRSSVWSRGTITAIALITPFVLATARAGASLWVAGAIRDGRIRGKRALLIGDYDELQYLRPAHLLKQYGVSEIARFELLQARGSDVSLNTVDARAAQEVVEFARRHAVDQILLVVKWDDVRRREALCAALRVLPSQVVLVPDRRIRSVMSKPIFQAGHLVGVELQRAPLSNVELGVKRVLDLALTVPALLLLAPLFLMVAVLIKLDSPGPAIFKQTRKGFGGRIFTIYKFRTMRMHSDAQVRQAVRGDARVTRIGRMLRSSSIDELPQLVNVLQGEMSLVGPRPHALLHDDEYGQWIGNYAFRHHVKPGITGWAQVHGFRGETPELRFMTERVKYDLWYINNWTIGLDCWILIRSCFEVVRSRNAY